MRQPPTALVEHFCMLNKDLMKLFVIFVHFPDWETNIIKPLIRKTRFIFNSDPQVILSVSRVRKLPSKKQKL